jgi:hypothetical protein
MWQEEVAAEPDLEAEEDEEEEEDPLAAEVEHADDDEVLRVASAKNSEAFDAAMKERLRAGVDRFDEMVAHEEGIRLGDAGWKGRYYKVGAGGLLGRFDFHFALCLLGCLRRRLPEQPLQWHTMDACSCMLEACGSCHGQVSACKMDISIDCLVGCLPCGRPRQAWTARSRRAWCATWCASTSRASAGSCATTTRVRAPILLPACWH